MMLERCSLPAAPAIVEIGCGPGKLLRAAAELTNAASVIGVDPEPNMLTQADGFEAHLGRAEALPLPGASADLAFSSLTLHLVQDWPAAAAEVHRVLKPGGWSATWTLTPEHVVGHVLNRWFPSLAGADQPRFRSPERWLQALTRAGFPWAVEEQVRMRRQTTVRRLAESVRSRYISTLALLPEKEFEAGLRHLEQLARETPEAAIEYEMTWCLMCSQRII
ncbi:MAG: methyltransferase domain-containing protein [Candidatus Dormibacteraeota bacterium]|uniref:Methyltransferase domain-containing protein n=1 Tax=Candidatus Dormiibacter inghamiae TaxID=3127013 RepID=A0A934KFL6_9BACT|nr:methyltransferase domain-containing protein [Candidatus Dormibacteraeota bacterium]